MQPCSHIAAYYAHRAGLYRRLHWYRHWEMARRENQKYAFLSIGILED
jgi:hypothetical protein